MNHRVSPNLYHSQKQYTLLTGATGLLGRYLMRDLLLKGHRLAVLVRPCDRRQARERLEQILQMWEVELGQRLPRPVLLAGDIRQPDLGLSKKQIGWGRQLLQSADSCRSGFEFSQPIPKMRAMAYQFGRYPTRTCVGPRNLPSRIFTTCPPPTSAVNRTRPCGKTSWMLVKNFATTTSVANSRQRNSSTPCDGFRSKTIYRPAVIVGDSETGYTSSYHGLFLYLRLMAMLVPLQQRNADGIIETPIKLPYTGDESRNLVPIDWVSRAICHLVETPEAHNRTYHLTPDHCASPREVIDYCYEYFHSDGVEFCRAQCKLPTGE